ncbi:MAG: hypothetical protein WBK77_03820 [Alphaproteobacteria bacterium]
MRAPRKNKLVFWTLALFIPAALGGCDLARVGGTAAVLNIFDRPDVNLAEKNYAAADYLMQAGGNFATKRDTIKAVALQNIAEPALTTRIGRVIAKQTGERLQQLGYNVDLTTVSTPIENDMPYAAPIAVEQADFILSGTYRNEKSRVDVRLRLVDAKSGKSVAQFDYGLPMSHEIQKMTRPKPKIFRTTPQTPATAKH